MFSCPPEWRSTGGTRQYAIPAGVRRCFKKLFLFARWKLSQTLAVPELRFYVSAEVFWVDQRGSKRCFCLGATNSRTTSTFTAIEAKLLPGVWTPLRVPCALFNERAGGTALRCTSCRARSTLHANWWADYWICMGGVGKRSLLQPTVITLVPVYYCF